MAMARSCYNLYVVPTSDLLGRKETQVENKEKHASIEAKVSPKKYEVFVCLCSKHR